MRLYNANTTIDDIETKGATLLYQIDPSLKPLLPPQSSKVDGYYGLPEDVTFLQLNLAFLKTDQYSDNLTREQALPRLVCINKRWTMKELHFFIFKQLKFCLAEWADWTHPETKRESKSKGKLLKEMFAFPYRKSDSLQALSAQEFMALSDEEAFEMCFPNILQS